MKRFYIVNLIAVLSLSLTLSAKTEEEYQKELDKLKEQTRIEGETLAAKMKNNRTIILEAVKQLNLEKDRSKFVPYQMNVKFNKNDKFLILEKESFMKGDAFQKEISGVAKKTLKLFTDDLTKDPSKMEITISEQNYFGNKEYVIITFEPANSDTPTFKRFFNGKEVQMKAKETKNDKVAEINAKKIENERSELLNSHLEYFRESLRFIIDSDKKLVGDSDALLNDFIRKGKDF